MARSWKREKWIGVAVCLMALPVSCARQKNDGRTHDPANTPLPKNESYQVNPDDTVFVATIDDPDLDTIVREELTAHGIVCYIEGSVVWGVSVPRNDAAKAKEVLRDSKRIDHEHLTIEQ